jgi:asparagine synthase (glutamine-hydrolysing)
MEFMGRVPSKWKIMGLREKYLLKKTFRGIVPDRIIDRPKQPYRAPISQGLLTKKSAYANELLSEHSLKETNLFDAPKVTLLLNKVRRASQVSEFNNMALAGILSSQIIHDKFINHFRENLAVPVSPNLFFDKRILTTREQNNSRVREVLTSQKKYGGATHQNG